MCLPQDASRCGAARSHGALFISVSASTGLNQTGSSSLRIY